MDAKCDIWDYLTNSPDLEVRKREYELVTSGKLHINSVLLTSNVLKYYVEDTNKLLSMLPVDGYPEIDSELLLLSIYCGEVMFHAHKEGVVREFFDYLFKLNNIRSILYAMSIPVARGYATEFLCDLYKTSVIGVRLLGSICTYLGNTLPPNYEGWWNLEESHPTYEVTTDLYNTLVEFEEQRGGDIRPIVEAISSAYEGKILNWSLQFDTKKRNDILVEMVKEQDISLYADIDDAEIASLLLRADENLHVIVDLLYHVGVSKERLLKVIQRGTCTSEFSDIFSEIMDSL